MSSQYRICQNCGASLAPGETICPRCGIPYTEPIIQKPGEFQPFPPDQANAAAQTEPYAAQPQQPLVLPVQQQQPPYPPQSQGYVPPSQQAQYGGGAYNQQAPGQVGVPPEPPESDTKEGLNISLIIGLVIALILLILLVGGLFFVLGQRNNTNTATTPTPGVTPTATATPGTTPTATSVPLQVTTVTLVVDPLSFDGQPCGKQVTFTYTATFNVLSHGPGGAVQFTYTTDGGRTTKTGVVQFSPGQSSMEFKFASSGTLQSNGAFPGAGQVTTTSPNTISSQAVTPSGTCTPVTPTP